jgi:hypothetical protein
MSLPSEAREDALKVMPFVYADCRKLLGTKQFLSLNSKDEESSLIDIFGQVPDREKYTYRDEKIDMVLKRVVRKLNEKGNASLSLVETYIFLDVFSDEGCVIREHIEYTPYRAGTSVIEEAGKDELENLTKEIRESSEYRAIAGMKSQKVRMNN